MGGKESKSCSTPYDSATLFPKHIKRLEFIFNKMKDQHSLKLRKNHFLKFVDFPDELQNFSSRFANFILNQPTIQPVQTPRKKTKQQQQEPNHDDFEFYQLVKVIERFYRGNSQQHASVLFDMYQSNNNITKEEVKEMLYDCALVSEYNRYLYTSNERGLDIKKDQMKPFLQRIDSIIDTILGVYEEGFPLDKHKFTSFFSHYLPNIGKGYEYLLWFKLLQEQTELIDPESGEVDFEEKLDFWPPYLLQSDISKIPDKNSFVWLMASCIDWNESTWKVIYAATNHGRSLNRLTTQIFDYAGPTFMLLSDRKGGIFGAFTTETWQSKANFRSDRTAFLFSLAPHFAIYKATGVDSNNLYLYNNQNPHVQFPQGIGFGGIQRAFRLWINDDLDRGESREICTSYSKGKICQTVLFEVSIIEVWGCGGEKADYAQQQAKVNREKEVERRRKVKKEFVTETWDSGPSKFVMDMVGKTGVSDEFLDDVRKMRQKREEEKEAREKALKSQN